MIIKQERVLYSTREHYGTSIILNLSYENNTLTSVSFSEGKIRENIEIPENKEDKKVWLVISAIKELITENKLDALNVMVYRENILVSYKDSEDAIFIKIRNALFDLIGIENQGVLQDVKRCIIKGLEDGEIDVF